MPRMMMPDRTNASVHSEGPPQHSEEEEIENDNPETAPIFKRTRRAKEESTNISDRRRILPERNARAAATTSIKQDFTGRKTVRNFSRSQSSDTADTYPRIKMESSSESTLASSSSSSRESSNEPKFGLPCSSFAGNQRTRTRSDRKRPLSSVAEGGDAAVNELACNLSTFKIGDDTLAPFGPEDGDHDSSSEDEDEIHFPDQFLVLDDIVQKPPLVPDSTSGDYEVERILLIRRVGKILYYLLKWKDYPLNQMSWAKQKDLRTCNKVLKTFEDRVVLCKKIFNLLPNKNEYLGFEDYYINSIITPAFNEQNLFEDSLVSFMARNKFAPLYVENWTRMCDVLPKDFAWTAKCLFSYPASLEVQKSDKETKNSIVTCDCEVCDPKICPCLDQTITARGLLRLNIANYISECNQNCGCSKCPSKVFRAGRAFPVMLFKTPKCGWSVRTVANIPERRFVMEYVGLIKIFEECEDIEDQTYLFNCDLPDSSIKFVIDATAYGNESRFINHHCEPNLEAFTVLGYYSNPNITRVVFFSNRDIAAGEELTFDYFRYELNLDEIDLKEKRVCRCGAKNCRKFLI